MSKSIRADWAALVPWTGVQDKPAFLDGPNGSITISDVEGLTAALASKAPLAGLQRVAFTGNYNDLNHLPVFGSAAWANVEDFVTAPTARKLQVGMVPFIPGTQSYAVVFTATMNARPKIKTQVFMADVNGELLSAVVQEDATSADGFTFWLTGVPALSTGHLEFSAEVQDQPA